MCCPLPFPPPQAGEGQGGGSGRARKARQKSLASVGVSPPTFSFVLTRSFLSVRHPCRSGAFQCFHRHWPAAARHGAPNEIGGDGPRQWRAIARMRKTHRENASSLRAPRGAKQSSPRAPLWIASSLSLLAMTRVRRRIARTLRHCERSEAIQSMGPFWTASSLSLLAMTRALRRAARMRIFFLSPLCGERSDCAAIRVRGLGHDSEPSGDAPSSQPSPRTRGEGARSGSPITVEPPRNTHYS
jgi:hypothetical protein